MNIKVDLKELELENVEWIYVGRVGTRDMLLTHFSMN